MALSSDILSAFAKITVEADKPNTAGTVVNGTAKAYAGGMYVQLDGSDQLTPITSSTAGMKDGDRVTVLVKDHKTTVTGNVSSPSVTTDEFTDTKEEIGSKIEEFENVIADTVTTGQLEAESARIDDLVTETLAVKDRLTATEADITDLTANKASITELEAAKAEIDQLEANMLTAEAADIKYATIANLEATNANIHNLQADYGEFEELATGKFTAIEADILELDTGKLSAEEADLKYANIDFSNIGVAAVEELFAKSGIIGDLVVSEGHITGHLVGVTISGDLIQGNTIKADKLVVLGDDGLYYKLNVSGESVAAEQTQYNSLNGSIITANTITAEKINVDDLVAFNATIGGFHIDDHALYSGAKASVDNTTRGTYMDDDGQFVIGDNNNYLKFFLDETDSKWKLQLSAESIKIGASGTSLEEKLEQIEANNGKLTETVSGNSILTAEDSGGRKPYDLKVYGQTKQNLWQNPSGISNGLTVTANEDGSVTLSGTPTSSNQVDISTYALKPGSTYTVSKDVETTGVKFLIQSYDSGGSFLRNEVDASGWGNVKTFTLHDDGAYVRFGVSAAVGQAVSGTYRVMLNEGSKAEPWCPPGLNGVDKLSVVTAGKNLLARMGPSLPYTIAGITFSDNGDSGIRVSGTATVAAYYNFFSVAAAQATRITPGEYTASLIGGDSGLNLSVGYYDGVIGGSYTSWLATNLPGVSNTGSIDRPVYLRPFLSVAKGKTVDTVVYPQLELGSTATEYEPPNINTVPIDLQGNELCSLPDGTRDELTVDGSGNVVLRKKTDVFAATTSTEWTAYDDECKSAVIPSAHGISNELSSLNEEEFMCDAYPVAGKNWGSANWTSYPSVAFSPNSSWTDKVMYCKGSGPEPDSKAFNVLYLRQEEQTIPLGKIDLSALPEGFAHVWITANAAMDPDFDLTYWTEHGKVVSEVKEEADRGITAAQDSASNASETAQDAMNELNSVRSEINVLTESISTLVTDGNGGSLMEQTEDGWTFNIGAIQSQLNNAVNNITDIQGDLSEKETVINAINGLVDDIAEKTAYINMTTDDGGSPCIELGESTSDFKLRITNTSIDFMQGTNKIAYITNESLYIQSSVVTDDFKIGAGAGFIWKRRSNGNMGLRWEAN